MHIVIYANVVTAPNTKFNSVVTIAYQIPRRMKSFPKIFNSATSQPFFLRNKESTSVTFESKTTRIIHQPKNQAFQFQYSGTNNTVDYPFQSQLKARQNTLPQSRRRALKARALDIARKLRNRNNSNQAERWPDRPGWLASAHLVAEQQQYRVGRREMPAGSEPGRLPNYLRKRPARYYLGLLELLECQGRRTLAGRCWRQQRRQS